MWKIQKNPQAPTQAVIRQGYMARYKVNRQNSITSLYTSNEQVQFEIKNTILCILAFKKRKYSGLILTKYI